MHARRLPYRTLVVLQVGGAMLLAAPAWGRIDVPNPFGNKASPPPPIWEVPPAPPAAPAAPSGTPNVVIMPSAPAPAVRPVMPLGTPNAAVMRPSATDLAKAQAGDVDAELRVGLSYVSVRPPNFPEAMKWFREASDQGSGAGALNVSQLYDAGLGVPRDPSEAVKWIQLAVDRGYAPAKARLGQHYEAGLGEPQSYADAMKWYRAAADQKDPVGETRLALMYASGRGVAPDAVEAVRLFRLAADQGYGLAQANLGFGYMAGKGIAQSDGAAYFWLNLATVRLPVYMTVLRSRAAQARAALAAKLPPAELARLQHMAATWKPGSTDVPSGAPATGAGN